MNTFANMMSDGILRKIFIEWPFLYVVPALLVLGAIIAASYYHGSGRLKQKIWVPIIFLVAALMIYIIAGSVIRQ